MLTAALLTSCSCCEGSACFVCLHGLWCAHGGTTQLFCGLCTLLTPCLPLGGYRYRGYVERVSPSEPRYEVFFIDFGNREKLPSDRVRPIDAALAAVPAQARPACLAYLKVPSLEEELGADAAAALAALVGGGKRLTATVVRRERGAGARDKHPRRTADKLHVTLVSEDGQLDVAREMLLAGMARLPKLHKVCVGRWAWV